MLKWVAHLTHGILCNIFNVELNHSHHRCHFVYSLNSLSLIAHWTLQVLSRKCSIHSPYKRESTAFLFRSVLNARTYIVYSLCWSLYIDAFLSLFVSLEVSGNLLEENKLYRLVYVWSLVHYEDLGIKVQHFGASF